MTQPEYPPQRVEPLDYAPPMRRPGRTRDLWLGIVISLFMSVGVGCLSFGLLIAVGRIRDDEAGIAAVGAALIVAALCLTGLVFFLRRSP